MRGIVVAVFKYERKDTLSEVHFAVRVGEHKRAFHDQPVELVLVSKRGGCQQERP